MSYSDGHLCAQKECTHEVTPSAHDTPPPTHGGRHANAQLLRAYHSCVSALCRRFRTAFPDLSRAPGSGTGARVSTLSRAGQAARLAHGRADGLCATVLVPGDLGTPDDAGLYPPSTAALHAADHPQPSRSRGVADDAAQSEPSRDPDHAPSNH